MTTAPGIDPHPDLSDAALQALRGDALYCNVAGSGPTFPVAQAAAERFRRWLNEVGMFGHLGYDAYNAALAGTRADLAAFIGDPDGAERIALTVSATDALNIAIAGLDLPAGSTLVTTEEEHSAALMPLYARRERGDRVVVLRCATDDDVVDGARRALDAGARAVVLSLVSCQTGKVLPAARVCALARAHGAVAIVDAAQALGQVPVDVGALGADAVAMLGHKWLHGPLATGALWVREPARFRAVRVGWRGRESYDLEGNMTLHADATRFETGTLDAAAFVGLRQALAVHRALGDRVGRRIRTLRARLFERLAPLPFRAASRPDDPTGIVTVVPAAGDAAGIVSRVWSEDRVVVKHLADPLLRDAIRISFWALHRESDIDRLAEALARAASVPA